MSYSATKPIFIIVGGPAGTGKTTTALQIAEILRAPYIEGDDLHPPENIQKMANGIPLQDEDRWGWLQKISEEGSEAALRNTDTNIALGTCSSLTRRYREYLKDHMKPGVQLVIAFLYASEEELTKRLLSRKGHYMGVNMVKSQCALMEVPSKDELLSSGGICININAMATPEEVKKVIMDDLIEYHVISL